MRHRYGEGKDFIAAAQAICCNSVAWKRSYFKGAAAFHDPMSRL